MIDISIKGSVMTRSWKLLMLRRVAAFVVAAIAMVLLGSAAHSYFVQQAWSGAAGLANGMAPAGIPFVDRISWAAHDFFGMFLPYSAVTSIALFVAFLVAGALAHFTGFRVIVFGLAGAAALFAVFTTMKMLLGTVGIFGARGPVGLTAQMAAGAVAGVLFARLSKTPNSPLPPTTRAS
jgi:hypothetical protein